MSFCRWLNVVFEAKCWGYAISSFANTAVILVPGQRPDASVIDPKRKFCRAFGRPPPQG